MASEIHSAFPFTTNPSKKLRRVLVHISHFVHRRRRRQTSDVAFSSIAVGKSTSGRPEWNEKIKNRHPRTNIPNRTERECWEDGFIEGGHDLPPPNHEQPRGHWKGFALRRMLDVYFCAAKLKIQSIREIFPMNYSAAHRIDEGGSSVGASLRGRRAGLSIFRSVSEFDIINSG